MYSCTRMAFRTMMLYYQVAFWAVGCHSKGSLGFLAAVQRHL